MRGRHHYKVILITIYDDDDEPTTEKILYETNKRLKAELCVERHNYLRIDNSDYCYRYLYIHKDY